MRYEGICTVCNAKFSFYQLSIIIQRKVLVSNFGLRFNDSSYVTVLLLFLDILTVLMILE